MIATKFWHFSKFNIEKFNLIFVTLLKQSACQAYLLGLKSWIFPETFVQILDYRNGSNYVLWIILTH